MNGQQRRDLAPPREKGGGMPDNDNMTLVRGAKAKKRDLPPRKTVKGGGGGKLRP